MTFTLRAVLARKIAKILWGIAPSFTHPEAEVAQSVFGHYQCNSCLKLAKEEKKSPRELAQVVAEALSVDPMLEKVEVAGPGFINMTLSSSFLEERLLRVVQDPFLGVSRPSTVQKIIVEFSSPNVAKELHVGHLRSTIIGDSLARIFSFLGHDVLRLNHIGDWGTQFGMLIHFIKSYHPLVLVGEQAAELTDLMTWYRESKIHFDADPVFKKKAQEEVVLLQGGNPSSLQAWQLLCAISRKAFEAIYSLLDVHIEERGESFYNPWLPQVIQDLEEKGMITVSAGAKCVFLPGFIGKEGDPLPMIVQKSDGGFNYETTDMAAVKHRVQEEKAQRIFVLTDAGQALHFAMVFAAAKQVGYYDPELVELCHVPFGVVLGPDGKKFKTRCGNTEKLIDLLQEAVDRAYRILSERLPDATQEEKERSARILGIDAVKYADLSCNRIKDYVFSYDKMLAFEGNTAAFLLYAYVRMEGIKRKGGRDQVGEENVLFSLEHPAEKALALHLCQLEETLEQIAKDLLPNHLAEYLYTLAEKFHAFYRDCRVEGSAQQASRLLLCEAAGKVLKQGLALLGLQTLQRM